MTKLRVLSDLHIGVNRSAGTTPVTQLALRAHLISEFQRLLPSHGDVMVNGDLFDTFSIPVSDVLQTYTVIAMWLTEDSSRKFYNVAGNHDLSKTSNVMSSFQFLGRLLSIHFPGRYIHIEQPTMTPYGYVIPHMPNQHLFDLELSRVPECAILFLHCNYDNDFAAESDHSLNISALQVESLQVQHVVMGHEHHPRRIGKVLIPGNQVASSVSDWQHSGPKLMVEIGEGLVPATIEATPNTEYGEAYWGDVADVPDYKFLRITGRVNAADLSKVISVINKLRKNHDAFVITNAVEVIRDDNSEVITESLEAVHAFSIWGALERIFTPQEYAILQAVNEEQGT